MQSKTDGKSAGRVQSVALKLIVDREREIRSFIPEEYYTIESIFDGFKAELAKYKNKKIKISTSLEADKILEKLSNAFKVESIETKEKKKQSKLPFTTSTLTQMASNRLNYPASKTMSIAQKLYEGVKLGSETVGLISYKASSSYALFQDELTGDETITVEAKSNYDKNFSYIGKPEEYTVQKDGYYYIEMAGAQGGSSYAEYNATYSGGKGSKTSGYIELKAGEKLYFYVGGQGKRCVCSSAKNCCGSNGGYNGGGYTLQYTGGNTYYGSGGGATDVRVVSGSWNTTSSLISRIMVAAGGGGASNYMGISSSGYNYIGGDGSYLYGKIGYYTRSDRTQSCTGGNQISGGTGSYSAGSGFGQGAYPGTLYGPGGGGGYYGGGTSEVYSCSGSSYISGYAGANSVTNSTAITHTNNTLHYSGKYFIEGKMLEGQNEGNGYAKITYVGEKPRRKTTKLLENTYYEPMSL